MCMWTREGRGEEIRTHFSLLCTPQFPRPRFSLLTGLHIPPVIFPSAAPSLFKNDAEYVWNSSCFVYIFSRPTSALFSFLRLPRITIIIRPICWEEVSECHPHRHPHPMPRYSSGNKKLDMTFAQSHEMSPEAPWHAPLDSLKLGWTT